MCTSFWKTFPSTINVIFLPFQVVNPRMTYGLAADIWSLGCTVIEMLTRQPPYSPLEWVSNRC